MGLCYDAETVLYNRAGGEIGVPVKWYATPFKNVRIDLKKAVTAGDNGAETSNTATFSVYDASLPKDYLDPEEWAEKSDKGFYFTLGENSFIVISYAPSLGVSIRSLPVGSIEDPGLLEKLKKRGHVYKVTGAAHYQLIPHWEIDAA